MTQPFVPLRHVTSVNQKSADKRKSCPIPSCFDPSAKFDTDQTGNCTRTKSVTRRTSSSNHRESLSDLQHRLLSRSSTGTSGLTGGLRGLRKASRNIIPPTSESSNTIDGDESSTPLQSDSGFSLRRATSVQHVRCHDLPTIGRIDMRSVNIRGRLSLASSISDLSHSPDKSTINSTVTHKPSTIAFNSSHGKDSIADVCPIYVKPSEIIPDTCVDTPTYTTDTPLSPMYRKPNSPRSEFVLISSADDPIQNESIELPKSTVPVTNHPAAHPPKSFSSTLSPSTPPPYSPPSPPPSPPPHYPTSSPPQSPPSSTIKITPSSVSLPQPPPAKLQPQSMNINMISTSLPRTTAILSPDGISPIAPPLPPKTKHSQPKDKTLPTGQAHQQILEPPELPPKTHKPLNSKILNLLQETLPSDLCTPPCDNRENLIALDTSTPVQQPIMVNLQNPPHASQYPPPLSPDIGYASLPDIENTRTGDISPSDQRNSIVQTATNRRNDLDYLLANLIETNIDTSDSDEMNVSDKENNETDTSDSFTTECKTTIKNDLNENSIFSTNDSNLNSDKINNIELDQQENIDIATEFVEASLIDNLIDEAGEIITNDAPELPLDSKCPRVISEIESLLLEDDLSDKDLSDFIKTNYTTDEKEMSSASMTLDVFPENTATTENDIDREDDIKHGDVDDVKHGIENMMRSFSNGSPPSLVDLTEHCIAAHNLNDSVPSSNDIDTLCDKQFSPDVYYDDDAEDILLNAEVERLQQQQLYPETQDPSNDALELSTRSGSSPSENSIKSDAENVGDIDLKDEEDVPSELHRLESYEMRALDEFREFAKSQESLVDQFEGEPLTIFGTSDNLNIESQYVSINSNTSSVYDEDFDSIDVELSSKIEHDSELPNDHKCDQIAILNNSNIMQDFDHESENSAFDDIDIDVDLVGSDFDSFVQIDHSSTPTLQDSSISESMPTMPSSHAPDSPHNSLSPINESIMDIKSSDTTNTVLTFNKPTDFKSMNNKVTCSATNTSIHLNNYTRLSSPTPFDNNSSNSNSHCSSPIIYESSSNLSHRSSPVISDASSNFSHRSSPILFHSSSNLSHRPSSVISNSSSNISHRSSPILFDSFTNQSNHSSSITSKNSHSSSPITVDQSIRASHMPYEANLTCSSPKPYEPSINRHNRFSPVIFDPNQKHSTSTLDHMNRSSPSPIDSYPDHAHRSSPSPLDNLSSHALRSTPSPLENLTRNCHRSSPTLSNAFKSKVALYLNSTSKQGSDRLRDTVNEELESRCSRSLGVYSIFNIRMQTI